MAKRSCSYCGKGMDCRCEYVHKKLGSASVKMQNTSRETNVAEMRKAFEDLTATMRQGVPVAWMFTITRIDDGKLVKSDAKRAQKAAGLRTIGNEARPAISAGSRELSASSGRSVSARKR